jgi:hypothetical protein
MGAPRVWEETGCGGICNDLGLHTRLLAFGLPGKFLVSMPNGTAKYQGNCVCLFKVSVWQPEGRKLRTGPRAVLGGV